MKINITSDKLELTDAIKDYLEKKINALEKFINTDTNNLIARAIIGKTTTRHAKGNHFKAEIKINIPGKEFFVQIQKDDLYAAIDEAQNVLKREIIKYKEVLIDKHQKG
jgi:putative sigma-54 modulation protein